MKMKLFTSDGKIHYSILRSYLVDGKSQRLIQEEILKISSPIRGGGFRVMDILHYYGIYKAMKGLFRRNEQEADKLITEKINNSLISRN